MDIRILPETCLPGCLQMGVDEAILTAGIPTLRFYTWQQPCVSLGYFQKSGEVNTQWLKQHNIALVRRLTGGKAVYHGQDLTYCIVLPEDSLAGGVAASYHLIGSALLHGLRQLGLQVEYSSQPTRARAAANCFRAAGWFEIYAGNRKLAGSAQVRRAGRLLQQGSLLLVLNRENVSHCFHDTGEDVAEYMTAVDQELARPVTSCEIAGALEQGFKENLPCTWYAGQLTNEEKQHAAELSENKYSSEAWNFSR